MFVTLKPPLVQFANVPHSAISRVLSAEQGSDNVQVSQASDIIVIHLDCFNLEIFVYNFTQPLLLLESFDIYQRRFRTNSRGDKTSHLTIRDVPVFPSEAVMM